MKNRPLVALGVTIVLALAAVLPAAASTSEPPTRLFLPIVFRPPEVIVLNASADAFVFESGPDINTGSELALYVGNDLDVETQMGIMRSFVRFDLPAIANSRVESARLRLYYAGYSDFENRTRTVFANAPGAAWDEWTITWANQPSQSYDIAGTVINSSQPFGYVEIDITDWVWRWLGGFEPNYGLRIKGPEDAGSDYAYRAFASRESPYPPQLVLTLR